MNDFGIVACLQDNGENGIYHKELIDKIADITLHPIQFEELCGRFIYSNYLLNTSSEYIIQPTEDSVYVEAVPLPVHNEKPLFRHWDDKMYGEVLANYWKPWGLGKNEIITFPNSPISYLINEYNYELIDPDTISCNREKHVKPILEELRQWIDAELQTKTEPKSAYGKALTYATKQWPKLIRIMDYGHVELDNNLIENKIRPLALGRKNYLFAGSHDAAQRIAMMYRRSKFISPYKRGKVY